MDKIYEYKGKHYCETDISHRDDDYEGSLYDLYWELRKDDLVTEDTVYFTIPYESERYGSAEDLVEGEFDDLVIGESTEEDVKVNREWRRKRRVERMRNEV